MGPNVGPYVTALLAIVSLILFVCGVSTLFYLNGEQFVEEEMSDEDRIQREEEQAENQSIL
tara:strand:- start:341 stop:523 length:183 start_codon:yes stop_codon:yes gene_type:complete